ncbi:MAG TPA: AMP-binding protein, partial [Terriglobales bacterium]
MTPTTILDLLGLCARERPQAPAYTYLGNGEDETDSVTYGELEIRAHAFAKVLRTYAAPMDRVVLICPSGLEFLTAFFGCLCARIVAVPMHSPRPGRHNDRLAAIIANADAKLVVTTRALLPKVQQTLRDHSEAQRLEILVIEDVYLSSPQKVEIEPIRAEDLAFLQYTSGSTSTPKGVMVSHGNLVANQRMMHHTFRGTQDSIVLGWLPLYHDMGLIGNVLQTLWMGGHCILMSPAAFLQRPARWLEAISKYHATISGGPDFAYRLCTEKITSEMTSVLDLSSWTVAFNGSEPIRPSTMERFAQRFEPCGFTRNAFVPCYGLAEATLFVSGKPAGEAPVLYRCSAEKLRGNLVEQNDLLIGNHMIAGSGTVADGLEVEIVDPETSRPCAFGQVGEIWITGPSVAQGYWQNEQATEEVFRAHTPALSAPFLRTGDLGFRLGDELLVTGRLKDLIITHGQNHYPQDIEATAAASDTVLASSVGAAFSLESESGSSVVLVQEVARQLTSPEELTRLERAIRRAVGEQEGITLERVVFVKFGSVPRTTSGKVRRQTCREMYRSGNLEELDRAGGPDAPNRNSSASSNETKEATRLVTMCQLAAEMAQIKAGDIDPGVSLLALGLDSLMMTNLRFQFEERLALSVSLESMLCGRSLRELSEEASDTLPSRSHNQSETRLAGISSEEYFLSTGQRAIWFLHLLAPQSPAYNLFSASRSDRPFNIPVLRAAFQMLTDRHSLLRSVVVSSEDGPIHRPLVGYEVDFTTVDGTAWNGDTLNDYLRKAANRPFNPSEAPPFCVHVVRQGERGDVLLVALHHLLADLAS